MQRGAGVVVVALVVLAGCGGTTGSAPITVTPAPVPTVAETARPPSAVDTPAGEPIGNDPDAEWLGIALAATGEYTSVIRREMDRVGRLVLSVRNVSEESVTVTARLERPGKTHVATAAGNRSTVRRELASSLAGDIVEEIVYRPAQLYYLARTARETNRVFLGPGWRHVELLETGRYAGVDCEVYSVFDYPGHRGCFSAGSGMAIHVVYSHATGGMSLEIELVSSTRTAEPPSTRAAEPAAS